MSTKIRHGRQLWGERGEGEEEAGSDIASSRHIFGGKKQKTCPHSLRILELSECEGWIMETSAILLALICFGSCQVGTQLNELPHTWKSGQRVPSSTTDLLAVKISIRKSG